jgi:hypothetical protein
MIDFGVVGPPAIRDVRELQKQITALLITTIRKLEQDEQPQQRDDPA